MALNDSFIKNSTKHSGKAAGDKHTDGGGMYLLVTAAGKYWRINYRFNEKRKTLALGVYPTVSLAEARKRREKARELLSKGIDPNAAKREEKQVKADLAANTFELVARAWLKKTAVTRKEVTQSRITTLLEHDVFLCLPSTLTNMPILSEVNASTMMARSPARQLSLRMCASPVIQK